MTILDSSALLRRIRRERPDLKVLLVKSNPAHVLASWAILVDDGAFDPPFILQDPSDWEACPYSW